MAIENIAAFGISWRADQRDWCGLVAVADLHLRYPYWYAGRHHALLRNITRLGGWGLQSNCNEKFPLVEILGGRPHGLLFQSTDKQSALKTLASRYLDTAAWEQGAKRRFSVTRRAGGDLQQ